ncbi:MAG TPA: S9 family peptidase [Bryobacteraceae bacterium]|nr:S9 family peptidase [Bryobacteraceae bacterium]
MKLRIFALLCLNVTALAQAPRYLDKETFFQMETITAPDIAPDGSQIVFTRGWTDTMKDQSQANLWLVGQDGQRPRELTQGAWRDSEPAWSPDGKRIAFLSTRSGTPQIHVMWADTREVSQLTHLDYAPSALRWSPDGKWIAFNMTIPDETPLLPIKLPKTPKGAQLAKPAVIVDRLSWGRDGVGPVAKGYAHVFVIDSALGGTPRQITQGNYAHSAAEWSPDGATMYVSAIRKPDAEYLKNDSEVYAIDVKSLAVKQLTSRKGPDNNPHPSPDGRWIAYTGFDEQGLTNTIASLYVMDKDGAHQRLWAGKFPSSPTDLRWAEDSSGVYYLMQERGVENLYYAPLKLDYPDKPRLVTSGNQVLTGVSIARNGTAAAVRSGPKEPGSLVAFRLDRPNEIRKLVDVNEDVLSGVKLGDTEELNFTAPDGLKVQGWLIKPAEFDASRKYPLVLYIHGGPWSMYTVGFSWDFQNFAASGYGVLFLNPRGSTGYGQDFVSGIQHSYPGKDFDDLMAGVDAALAKGWVDKDNLFVCGGSGGGVLTAWIVGHTNRFRAAVSMRPVIDWGSFVGNTDGASWYDQFTKYPWEDPAQYAERSPLHYVANVTTPTMVMTGEADLRTPITQSEEFYRALKLLKKDTLLVRMPEEFHGWRRPSHRIMQQLYLMAWFEKWKKAS